MVGTQKTQTRRQQRVGEMVRAEISRLLTTVASDKHLAWVTITGVVMSPDLRHARVFFVPTKSEDPGILHDSLKRSAPFLQRELGRSLELRFTPVLAFQFDESLDRGYKIDELISQTSNETEMKAKKETPEEILARLVTQSDKILLCAHANPDGDAIGSLLGLGRIFHLLGKKPVLYCPDGVPGTLLFLPGSKDVVGELDVNDEFDLTVLLDTADESLLPRGFPSPQKRGTLAVIDHHMTHGEMGDIIIRRKVSAVGELLFHLTKELVWPVDSEAAQCFYTSIVSDTGSFRYTSTTPATHHTAADLITLGADPWKSATALYESYPVRRQRLLAAVAGTLRLSDDGRYAYLYCTPKMLEQTGAVKADLDGMINLGRSVDGVEISAMFRLEPEGHVKVSFRSKGQVDVADLAAQFGGGGHRNASGATIHKVSMEEAVNMVRDAARDFLDRPSAFDSNDSN